MKKKSIIALVLAMIMVLSLCACGGAGENYYSIGDTVETESVKMTLKDAQFTYAVNGTKDADYLKPTEPSPLTPYVADDGAVMVYYEIDIAAIGRSDIDIDNCDIATITYDGEVYDADMVNYMSHGNSTGYGNLLLSSGQSAENHRGFFQILVDAPLDSEFLITFNLPSGQETEQFTFKVGGEN